MYFPRLGEDRCRVKAQTNDVNNHPINTRDLRYISIDEGNLPLYHRKRRPTGWSGLLLKFFYFESFNKFINWIDQDVRGLG